jgi:hypothetical protein
VGDPDGWRLCGDGPSAATWGTRAADGSGQVTAARRLYNEPVARKHAAELQQPVERLTQEFDAARAAIDDGRTENRRFPAPQRLA